MVGVLAVAVNVAPTLRSTPGLESLSFPALVAVAAVNSTLLLVVFVLLGTLTAPRVGLRSHVYAWGSGGTPDWGELREALPLALAVGAGLFVAALLLELAFAPFVTLPAGPPLTDAETLQALAASAPTRLLYGGITEELLLRWGLMAPLAWLGWRVRSALGGAGDEPSRATMWTAIVVSAVAFGVGHLPALAATLELTPGLVVRTVTINAVVGVGFGWLFWRRSLEAAMVAHAGFHVTLLAVSTGIVLGT
jgi:hypothetical protein